MNIPGLIIGGTNSGCGKTTISLGIMAAFVRRGIKVKPFKVGPDYIDPMFHSFVTGIPSNNLDSWMLDENTLKYLYGKNSVGYDISIIEGVMGFYDGLGGTSIEGSTAHVSKITGAPVVLVVNGEGIALSIAPIIKGFLDFDKDTNIKGVILNKIKSDGHYQLLKGIIESHTELKVYGYLKPLEQISLKSRHLGLITSLEIADLSERIQVLADKIEESIDLDGLRNLSKEALDIEYLKPIELNNKYSTEVNNLNKTEENNLNTTEVNNLNTTEVNNRYPNQRVQSEKSLKIGIAKDKAFCFYYQDNLDLLEDLGAKLIEFSPLTDRCIPEGLDGLYVGGGYPEVFAKELSNNYEMKSSIKAFVEKGFPAYAECGGFMYMSSTLILLDGQAYPMVGLINKTSRMTNTLSRFGYVELEAKMDNIIAKKGQNIRGHEFHYSSMDVLEGVESIWRVSKKKHSGKEISWECGNVHQNLLAAYPHLHFYSNINFAKQFIQSCYEFREAKKND